LAGDLSDVKGNIGGAGEKFDFSEVRKYTDPMEAVRDPEATAVDICLPTHLHGPVAIEALRHGKDVLVEKPMALDGETADRMIGEAEKRGQILMTAQVLRFLPTYAVLGEALGSGRLGHVHSAFFTRRCAARGTQSWIIDSKASGGGAFDLLVHDIDMCLHLFGVPEAVSAWGYDDMSHGIDVLTAQLHYPNIDSVTITGGWYHPKAYPLLMEYTIVADGGTIEFSSSRTSPTLYGASGQAQALPMDGSDGYRNEIQYFATCAAERRQPVLCPPRESANAVKLARLAMKARDIRIERLAYDSH
jgi:predicted dehydrogenase